MYSILQSLCCCNGEGSDDEGPLINDTDGGHFGTATPSDSASRFWVNGAEQHVTSHTTSNGPGSFRQGSDEDELLNQILEATQQNIIDVANMDGATTPYKEHLSKAQRYSDAVRQHDLRVRKHAFNTTPEVRFVSLIRCRTTSD
ncbi:hypothetical protein LOAG_08039 [Loa loa]|uniref:Late endosomal/lysosomal adaptor and MAPK and MTOR activator 1 n=1 Tax=Loa loa TaxID=7209 RepID=A0A1S0TVA4_LOALO|nr:hypothetical protein LOAG_08039 [Loa loa]EFO20450.2 hypothetical protein LOAG_08039 [Loa loa]